MADSSTVKVNVVDASGKAHGTLDLDAAVFGAPIHGALLHQAVVRELNGRRAGTHDTKGRSEVSGGGKKPWKQKGTGRARQGSIRATQWKGGGKPFGPTPRKYGQAMPPTGAARRAAGGAGRTRSPAGSSRWWSGSSWAQPKTKALVGLLAGARRHGDADAADGGRAQRDLVRACQNVPWLTLGAPGPRVGGRAPGHDRVVAERQALVATQERLLA